MAAVPASTKMILYSIPCPLSSSRVKNRSLKLSRVRTSVTRATRSYLSPEASHSSAKRDIRDTGILSTQ